MVGDAGWAVRIGGEWGREGDGGGRGGLNGRWRGGGIEWEMEEIKLVVGKRCGG